MRLLLRCVPALLAILVYYNALDGSFHFDDSHAVVDNPTIRSAAHLERHFQDASTFSVLPQNQSYRPLLLTTYALTAEVTGVTARAFIAVNLLVHVVCVLLFQLLLRRVVAVLGYREDERLTLAATALFAVHPLFSECVNYVSARSESLCALLCLSALLAYFRGRETGKLWPLVGVAAAMFAAFLVKPVAISVPFLALLVEVAAAQRQSPAPVLRRLLWLAVPAAAGMLLTAKMTPAFAIASASGFSRLDYARSELPAILYYLTLFAWPIPLNADHDFPASWSLWDPKVLLSLLVYAGMLLFIARALVTRRHVGVAVSLAWFLVCILPSSSFFPLAELVAERRPYLAAAGLCPLVAAALLYGVGKVCALEGPAAARAGQVAAVLAIGVFAVLTVGRNRVWKTEETLWRDVVAKAPRSGRAHMNYGLTLMAQGRMGEAEIALRDAIRFAPSYSYAHINLGIWLLHHGRKAEAKASLDRAIALRPNLVAAHYHRGLAANGLGESPAQRVGYFRRAVELSPNHVDAQYQLARASLDAGDLERAEAAARKVVALRGGYHDRLLLASVLLQRGEAREAEPILRVLRRERARDPVAEEKLDVARRLLAEGVTVR